MEKNDNKHEAHSQMGRRHLLLAYGKTVFEPKKTVFKPTVFKKSHFLNFAFPCALKGAIENC